jgi:hypothetical protein
MHVSGCAGSRQNIRGISVRTEAALLLIDIVSCAGKITIILTLRPLCAQPVNLSRIIAGSGFGVLQDIVGGGYGLEPFFCARIVGVEVRMTCARQFAVGLLDVVRTCSLGQAKDFIGIIGH